MTLDEQVRILEDALRRLGVTVREARLEDEARLAGGLCRFRGELVLFLDRTRQVRERREVLLDALGRVDTDGIWLPPVLREGLRRRPDQEKS